MTGLNERSSKREVDETFIKRAKPAPSLSKTKIFLSCQQQFRGFCQIEPFCVRLSMPATAAKTCSPHMIFDLLHVFPLLVQPTVRRGPRLRDNPPLQVPPLPVALGIFLSAGHAHEVRNLISAAVDDATLEMPTRARREAQKGAWGRIVGPRESSRGLGRVRALF